MQINGTLINYYIHCKRQCYLHGNRLNLEDNSKNVKIGKAIHEEKACEKHNSEIEIENIKVDRLTSKYLTETKKSDADLKAGKWQLLYYLKVLKRKGILRKGRLEILENNRSVKKVEIVELTREAEEELGKMEKQIIELIQKDDVPSRLNITQCKKCAYYEYCYI